MHEANCRKIFARISDENAFLEKKKFEKDPKHLHSAFNILYIIMKYVTSTETIILQKLSQKKSLVAWTGLIA